MKNRTFEIPVDSMEEFAEIIGDNELNNTIKGVNEDGDIIVDVHYEPKERAAVFEIFELLDPNDEYE